MAALRLVGWGTTLTAAAHFLWRKWRRARARSKFDGLDGVVSFSSRLIAAARAIESLRADALFFDPFAQLLAGPKAMARHEGFGAAGKSVSSSQPTATQPAQGGPPGSQQVISQQPQDPTQCQQQQAQHQQLHQQLQQQQQAVPQYEGRQVSRLVLRTVFFDEATLLVTGQPAPRSDRVLAAVAQHMQQHQLQPVRQVVMLGAGMDTRPWRLPLPQNLSWFEVDRADVLAAKQAALQDAGASFAANANSSSSNSSSTSSSLGPTSSSGDSSTSKHATGCVTQQHPLRVGRWGCASADLQKAGWISKLQEAGLDPNQPTAWSAEGLLYYLEPSTVGPMLKEAAANSPPGSFLIANFVTDEGLKLLHSERAAARSDSTSANSTATNSNGTDSSSTSTLPGGSQASSATAGFSAAEAAPAPGTNSSGAGSGAAGVAAGEQAGRQQQGSAGSKPAGSGLQNIRLTSQFKWGCPDGVEQFFAECGWRLLVRYSLTQATHAYGWEVQRTPGSKVRTDSQQVQYVVGVVIK